MPLSDSEVRSVVATSKRQYIACGNALYLVVEPISKGGGKSFMGRTRLPPGRSGKQVDYRIVPYGKGSGRFSLKQARDEWERVRTWSRENNRPPTDLKKDRKQEQERQRKSPTFREACDAWDRDYSAVSEKNKPEYRRLIQNQLLPEFGASNPVVNLSWDHTHPDGRSSKEWFVNYLDRTRERAPTSASKQETLLRQIFANAAMEVIDLDDLDEDSITVVTNALTQEEMIEEGETCQKRCSKEVSLGMLNFGLKKNKDWSPKFHARDSTKQSNTDQG